MVCCYPECQSQFMDVDDCEVLFQYSGLVTLTRGLVTVLLLLFFERGRVPES